METRREIIRSGLGLAAIIAAGKAPAAIVRSLAAARNALMAGGGEPTYSGSAFRIDISQSVIESGGGSVAVGFSTFSRLSGYASVPIDWGDGSTPTAATSTSDAVHTYTTAGSYVVNIEDGISQFRPNTTTQPLVVEAICWGDTLTNAGYTYYGCSNLAGSVPAWGAAITNAMYTYRGCSGLTGSIPAWNDVTTNASSTYYGCSGLTGSVPEWNSEITNASSTYTSCGGLTGSIPAWNDKITGSLYLTYYYCTGLTGPVPEWNANNVTPTQTYHGCTGLTGSIPKWGAAMTSAYYTYYGCIGLTGVWEEDGGVPPVSSLMPNTFTSHDNCVGGTAASLRAYFYTTWGGTVTPP